MERLDKPSDARCDKKIRYLVYKWMLMKHQQNRESYQWNNLGMMVLYCFGHFFHNLDLQSDKGTQVGQE